MLFNDLEKKIWVLHENDEWMTAFREAFARAGASEVLGEIFLGGDEDGEVAGANAVSVGVAGSAGANVAGVNVAGVAGANLNNVSANTANSNLNRAGGKNVGGANSENLNGAGGANGANGTNDAKNGARAAQNPATASPNSNLVGTNAANLQPKTAPAQIRGGAIDLDAPAPRGVFWSRLSASSHTRNHPFAKDFGRAILAWLEASGRRVINGGGVLELEVSKVAQHLALKRAGFVVPRTRAVFGTSGLLAAARDFSAELAGGAGAGFCAGDENASAGFYAGGADFGGENASAKNALNSNLDDANFNNEGLPNSNLDGASVQNSNLTAPNASSVAQNGTNTNAGGANLGATSSGTNTNAGANLGATSSGGGAFITKHNQGGKGLGVRLFGDFAEFAAAFDEFAATNAPADGITLIQEYVRAKAPFITRAEFVGGRFCYAVRVDTSDGGFELCPAEACDIERRAARSSKPALAAAACEIGAKFELRRDITAQTPFIQALERFLAAHKIQIAGVEFIETAAGELVVYDINTNTNYNQAVEAQLRARGEKCAADRVVEFLLDELNAI